MNPVVERSKELFDSGLYCAESVLQAVAEYKGVESDLIPKIATGFCGGMARNSGPCGVVSGGVMAIGLICGRNHPQVSPYGSYDVVQVFMGAFAEAFGSVNCSELLGCDLGTPDGYEKFQKNGLREEVCQRLVAEGTAILMDTIDGI